MASRAMWLVLVVCLAVLGCSNSGVYLPDDGWSGGDGAAGDASSGGDSDGGASTDDASGGDASGDDTSDGGGGSDDDTAGTGLSFSGTILAPGAAKVAPRSQAAEAAYTVIAQSSESGEIYRAQTDAEGDFQLDLPEDEEGNSFMVTILGSDGRAVGPLLFGEADGDGLTGLAPEGETSLGTIALPDEPDLEPIVPGADSDVTDLIDPDLTARLDDNGVPVGLASHGKGQDAEEDEPGAGDRLVDADRDGLIDVFDADDDGDGIVDDFDADADADAGGTSADINANFFMNLKIGAEQASPYYSGDTSQIDDALSTDTIITFEVMNGPASTRTITAAHVLETPAPTYLPDSEQMTEGEHGLNFTPWADSDYAFDEASDRFQAFVRPNAVMDAGDTFTVEVEFDDGTSEQYSRMINYVFKNIPKVVQYGVAGALEDFDVSDPTINGSPSQPIPFDGTQDLVLVFNPPPDETGAYLTDLDYTFQIFYNSADDGSQLNEDIDFEATWPSPPTGFEGATYWVYADDLTLSTDDTYTVTLPKELFPDTVHTTADAEEAVGTYKIDITAECSSGNAAIMLVFEKQ